AFADPTPDALADGNEMGDAVADTAVPRPKASENGVARCRTNRPPATRPEVLFPHVPRVAHWGETVTHVRHAGRRKRRLGNAVAQAHDQVAGRQAPPRRRRIEWQELAVVVPPAGQAAEPTCRDRAGIDRPR